MQETSHRFWNFTFRPFSSYDPSDVSRSLKITQKFEDVSKSATALFHEKFRECGVSYALLDLIVIVFNYYCNHK